MKIKKVKLQMGRIGKCECGGELSIGEVDNDYALNYICKKCLKRKEVK